MEGASFLPLLLDPTAPWRTGFLIEHMASHGGNGVPSYCGFHTKRYVLVRYNGDDGELYDLRRDPWQRDNLLRIARLRGGAGLAERAAPRRLRAQAAAA